MVTRGWACAGDVARAEVCLKERRLQGQENGWVWFGLGRAEREVDASDHGQKRVAFSATTTQK